MPEMTMARFLEMVASETESLARLHIKALRGVDVSTWMDIKGSGLDVLRDAGLPAHIVDAIAYVIADTAYLAAISALSQLEGQENTVRLTDGKGRVLREGQGVHSFWNDIWRTKYGGPEGVAASGKPR